MKKSSLPALSEAPGVYLFWQGKVPIYIGKAINLKNRITSYFDLKLSAKSAKMVESAERISIIKVASELEAVLLEASLIKKYQPKYNFIAKDDKHALYIKITKEKYPRVITVRKNDFPSFGPFPSSNKVYSTLRMLRKIFPFADHKLGKRPCIYSQIGLCHPCPNEIEGLGGKNIKVLRKQYLKNIKNINLVLSGKSKSVVNSLNKEMKSLSENELFEKANEVRKQIENLNYITQKPTPENNFLVNPNLEEDIKREELKNLKEILNIKSVHRIECCDISHISGFLPTASMITFIDASPDKSLYRRFKIISSKNNDVLSMTEIAKRRLKHLKKWGVPDLIFVDGGKAQVNAFRKVFCRYQIPIVAITKGRESLDFSKGPALNLTLRIRNESHRFAQKYHNLLFKKNLLTM